MCFCPIGFLCLFYSPRIYESCKQTHAKSVSLSLSFLETRNEVCTRSLLWKKRENFVFIMVELGPYEVLVQLTNDVTQLSAISSTNQLV